MMDYRGLAGVEDVRLHFANLRLSAGIQFI